MAKQQNTPFQTAVTPGLDSGGTVKNPKRVGPVSILLVMFIAAIIGMPVVPTLMPDVVGLGAQAAQITAKNYVTVATLATENNVSLENEILSDWVVYEQRPGVGEEIDRNTPVTLMVRLSDDAVARRAEEARVAAETAEAERVAAVQAAEARIEAERIAQEQAEIETARIEAERVAREQYLAEQAEQRRLPAEQAERDRQAAAAQPTPTPTATPEPDLNIPARFRNCAHVWEVLGRPINRGERGFHSGLDRDGDGVGCEQRPRS